MRPARGERNRRLRAKIALNRRDEEGFDVHAGEIEIAGVGAGFMRGDFREAGQTRAPGAAGLVGKANAPGQHRAMRVGGDLHRRGESADLVA